VEGWKGALEDKLNTKEAQESFKNDLTSVKLTWGTWKPSYKIG